ncbi:MAG: hypothetical protein J7603_20870, partial [Pseudacidovorax sp.]|nr:hypothetical protein [Pseudacidovorax sp.]
MSPLDNPPSPFSPPTAEPTRAQREADARVVPLEPFRSSKALSLGVELELQLVNTHDYDLAPYAE